MIQQHKASQGPVFEVVWPLGKLRAEEVTPGPRVSDLAGKTVGQVWDWAFKGDQMFPIIQEKLKQRYPGIKFVDYSAFGNTHGRDEVKVLAELPEKLKQHGCDVVISGVGA